MVGTEGCEVQHGKVIVAILAAGFEAWTGFAVVLDVVGIVGE